MAQTRFVHKATYGGMGHSRLPQYEIRGNAVYGSMYNRAVPHGKALYTIQGRSWYPTSNHPDGKNAHPLYTMRGDRVHTTRFNTDHNPSQHAFVIREHGSLK
ncbi:MAG TPA: hypothetical protein VFL98_00080 [Candidatus Paceibacterota bacterium]|nr:hypothetical protein [Candidatus Paceibacterota bacterium]